MNDVQAAFRLPHELVERLDAQVARMRREAPGFRISRADVLRLALRRGLDALELSMSVQTNADSPAKKRLRP